MKSNAGNMKEDLSTARTISTEVFKMFKMDVFSRKKKKKPTSIGNTKKLPAPPGTHVQPCHSDMLGHLSLFPKSIPAFSENSDLKGWFMKQRCPQKGVVSTAGHRQHH